LDDVMLEFSLVLAANSHNPTILNKDWLGINEIVLSAWGWELSSQPISTPPLSQINYNSGISLTLDPGRLVVKSTSNFDDCYGPALEITKRYVSTLPHIPYTAVGINFKVLVACDNAKKRIVEAFIKDGPWIDNSEFTSALKFIYHQENCVRNVSLEPGEYKKISESEGTEEKLQVISFDFNYHRESDPKRIADSTQESLDNFQNDNQDYKDYLSMIKSNMGCEI
jgi:hypothetical protein